MSRELLVEGQHDPAFRFASGASRSAHRVEELASVERGDVLVPIVVAPVAHEHAADGEVDPLHEGRGRHEVAEWTLPDPVLELGLDVVGKGGVVEAHTLPQDADEGMGRTEASGRERNEGRALRVVLQLRSHGGRRVLGLPLRGLDDEDRSVRSENRCRTRAHRVPRIGFLDVSPTPRGDARPARDARRARWCEATRTGRGTFARGSARTGGCACDTGLSGPSAR